MTYITYVNVTMFILKIVLPISVLTLDYILAAEK